MRGRELGALFLATVLASCQAPTPRSAREVSFAENGSKEGRRVTEAELLQDIERFTTRFDESLTEAAEPLARSSDAKLREQVMKRLLLYTSSSLDIATGGPPEIALLDMIVFVTLSNRVFRNHWVPEVFGESGRPIEVAFADAERSIWTIGGKVLSVDQQAKLRALIEDWLKQNPNQVRVEATRFSDFSVLAGRISEQRAKEASGLFGSVKSATMAADDALLLAQRALFLAHRMPFLIRLQARLGASEIVGDTVHYFEGLEEAKQAMPEVRALMQELMILTKESKETAVEAQAALRVLSPILQGLPPQEQLQKTLGSASQLTERTGTLLERLRAMIPTNGAKVGESASAIMARADRFVLRCTIYLILIGAAWSVFFWGGYYTVKRLSAPPPASHDDRGADGP